MTIPWAAAGQRAALRAFVLALGLVAAHEATAQSVADPLEGRWAGHGSDTRGDEFDIELRIFADGSTSVAYEGVFEGPYQCAGLLLPMTTGRRRFYREVITEGTCIDGATVTLGPLADHTQLSFDWLGTWEESGLSAHGTLTRRQ